jgi:hypothetical protein
MCKYFVNGQNASDTSVNRMIKFKSELVHRGIKVIILENNRMLQLWNGTVI